MKLDMRWSITTMSKYIIYSQNHPVIQNFSLLDCLYS